MLASFYSGSDFEACHLLVSLSKLIPVVRLVVKWSIPSLVPKRDSNREISASWMRISPCNYIERPRIFEGFDLYWASLKRFGCPVPRSPSLGLYNSFLTLCHSFDLKIDIIDMRALAFFVSGQITNFLSHFLRSGYQRGDLLQAKATNKNRSI